MDRNRRRTLEGIVMSKKMDKTAIVMVVRKERHPRYEKLVERRKKYYVHDEKNVMQEGQKVRIEEARPLSKLKRWRLEEILH